MAEAAEALPPPLPHEELTTGERIHLLRKREGLSLRELATKVGVSHPTLSDYERGKAFPTAPTLRRLAEELRTTTDYLVGLRQSSRSYISGGQDSGRKRSRRRLNSRPLQANLLIRSAP